MGLSAVLDIKPRAELLWVLAIKSGGCWKERDVSLGARVHSTLCLRPSLRQSVPLIDGRDLSTSAHDKK